MALAVGFEDARKNQFRRTEKRGNLIQTPFFGSREAPDLPHAGLSQRDPGRYSPVHFHARDQFQVILAGKGRIGRHDLVPYCVHFARAYTPYGPLVNDAHNGLTFLVMRAHYDPGSQKLPENAHKLKQIQNRQPWQITRTVVIPSLHSNTTGTDFFLQSIPDIKDDHGLAAYALNMKPNAKALAPDPTHGDGQYLVVLKGSVRHEEKEYKSLALVFIYPKEDLFEIHSGANGLEALVLKFPYPQTGLNAQCVGAKSCQQAPTSTAHVIA